MLDLWPCARRSDALQSDCNKHPVGKPLKSCPVRHVFSGHLDMARTKQTTRKSALPVNRHNPFALHPSPVKEKESSSSSSSSGSECSSAAPSTEEDLVNNPAIYGLKFFDHHGFFDQCFMILQQYVCIFSVCIFSYSSTTRLYFLRLLAAADFLCFLLAGLLYSSCSDSSSSSSSLALTETCFFAATGGFLPI